MALFHDGKLTVGRLRLDHPRRDTPEMERTASVAMPEDLGAEVPVRIINPEENREQERGTVVLEDLRDILHEIAHRDGPNGPQSPVTQYLSLIHI